MEKQGFELPILVDVDSFREEHPDAPDLFDTQVRFPPAPKTMSVGQVLTRAVNAIPTGDATFLVRHGYVEIMTEAKAAPGNQKVLARFVNRPLEEVLQELQQQTGISIILDPRVDAARKPITATFIHGTRLLVALDLLADQVGLTVRTVDRTLYMTSPQNQARLPGPRDAQKKPNPPGMQ
jgi:hypothetical protein